MTATHYKLLDANAHSCNGGWAVWHLPKGKRPGKWMDRIPNPVLCERGYHVVTAGHVLHWRGFTLWEVEVRGAVVGGGGKLAVEQARLLRRVPGWSVRNERLLGAVFAARVLHLFESEYPNDDYPREAILAVLDETTADGDVAWAAETAGTAGAALAARAAAAAAAAGAGRSARVAVESENAELEAQQHIVGRLLACDTAETGEAMLIEEARRFLG